MLTDVLVVEDDPLNLELVCKLLSKFGYTLDFAQTKAEAVACLKNTHYQILLADLGLPDGDGASLINIVEKERSGTVSVIMSANTDIDRIIQLLRFNRAMDYLIKPVVADRLQSVMAQARSLYERQKKLIEFSKAETEIYRQAVEIFDWKQELNSKSYEFVASNMIHQMNLGLFQGEGVGALMSAIWMIIDQPADGDGSVKVSGRIIKSLKRSFSSTQRLVESMQTTQKILRQQEADLQSVPLDQISRLTSQVVDRLQNDAAKKSQRIHAAEEQNQSTEVRIDLTLFELSINELLVNALKYAPNGDEIYILMLQRDHYLEWKVINAEPPNLAEPQRLVDGAEQHIFEPFFRLHTFVLEGYENEQFPLGLGLPVVKKAAELCGGSISVSRVANHTASKPSIDICFTLRLPLADSPIAA